MQHVQHEKISSVQRKPLIFLKVRPISTRVGCGPLEAKLALGAKNIALEIGNPPPSV